MSENKDNKLTLINEKTANDYLTHTKSIPELRNSLLRDILFLYFLAEKWRCVMAVSYKKLFHLLIEKNMTNAQLQQEAGFSANIITRLKRGGYISLESVESICRV